MLLAHGAWDHWAPSSFLRRRALRTLATYPSRLVCSIRPLELWSVVAGLRL
jgi:hypothetical protein